jgi:formylglycine-generating enzyme required for sulfatase activity
MGMSVEVFGRAVVASGAMEADEIKAIWASFAPHDRAADGAALAKRFVAMGKLTEFQAAEVLSGRQTPLILGNYVLLARIGAGGMGQVFKAEHRHMKRPVAIKILPAALTKDETAIKRFQREVHAAARLMHPNIVQAHDASFERGAWYLVMEYVDGSDLSVLMKERGPFAIDAAVDCILQAARGLAFAHGEGVVHRDIKPANLLLDKKGTIKILDMGLARFDDSGDADEAQLTNAGQVMGTVDYMAPEQAASTKDADARSDIYSLGCTLYRLLTGVNMYNADSLVKKIVAHMHEPVPSLRAKRPDVPAGLEQIYALMVAKQPADRFQATSQLVAALEAFRNGAAAPIAVAKAYGAALAESAKAGCAPPAMRGPGDAGSNSGFAFAMPDQPLSGQATIGNHFAEIDTKSRMERANPATRNPVADPPQPMKRKLSPPVMIGGAVSAVLLVGLIVWMLVSGGESPEVAQATPSGTPAETAPPAKPLAPAARPVAATAGPPVAVAPVAPPTPASSTTPSPFFASPTPAATSPSGNPAVGTALALNTTSTPGAPLPPATGMLPPPDRSFPLGELPPLLPEAEKAQAMQKAWGEDLKTKIELTDSLGVKLMLIPAGEFMMGSTDAQIAEAVAAAKGVNLSKMMIERIETGERPQHKVIITKPYYMAATEVSVAQFRTFVEESKYVTEAEIDGYGNSIGKTTPDKANPNDKDKNWRNPGYYITEDSPVVQVTWNDASAFCRWLSTRENASYRLPTEAEWEFACRAGTTGSYCFGEDFSLLDQFLRNGPAAAGRSHPVGTRHPNAFGLHDMHGNVYEWCLDQYLLKWYERSPEKDPAGYGINITSRTARGGSYSGHPLLCRSASRTSFNLTQRNTNTGFRVLREYDGPSPMVASTSTKSAASTIPSTTTSTPLPLPTATASISTTATIATPAPSGTSPTAVAMATATSLPAGVSVPSSAAKPDDDSLAGVELHPQLEFMSGLTVPVPIGKVSKEGLPSGTKLILKGLPKTVKAYPLNIRAVGDELLLPITAPDGTAAGPYEVEFLLTRGKDRKEQKVTITLGGFNQYEAIKKCVALRPIATTPTKVVAGRGYTFQVDLVNLNAEPLAVPANENGNGNGPTRYPLGSIGGWIERIDGTKTITLTDTRAQRNGNFYRGSGRMIDNKPQLTPGVIETISFPIPIVAGLPAGKYRIVFDLRSQGEPIGRIAQGPDDQRQVSYNFEVVNP